jgi:radical SAM-linked protein
MVGEKIRFRFEKAGDLRLLSHLDLMRCCERMLRRARLPFKSTQGFHPTPRLVFALSLPLGVAGRNDVAELELTEPLDAEDVRARLNEQAPNGLRFIAARTIESKACAMPRRVVYRLRLPDDRANVVRFAIGELLAGERVWVDRLRPRPRRLNIKPYIRGLEVVSASEDRAAESFLLLDLWVTQSGTARADELLRLLGVADLTDAGEVLDRTHLELHDETPPGQPDGPPSGPPETARLEHVPAVAAGDEEAATPAAWGGSPHGPVVE